ncbi:hypothetical protein GMLC_13480 [Geomonas limicola]|uniref:Transposase n=1 Tax=Geomonas limicola TaxID=2740186 RepID=A0A6V8N924_9BACT|nr:TnsA endonuclease N-terminal domain-containing protein [Geomonas limicola]GFO67769.1 hypothetical protein GMLC_13480 [Geomonas limicola]
MARKKSSTNTKIKEGRGLGHGKGYKPFLRVGDVPSLGKSSRPKGWKTERTHQLLSSLELNYFYVLEWAPGVVDVREQFPLPLEETLEIAKRLGIKHSADNATGESFIMTTDFLVDEVIDGKTILKARSIKPASELGSKRVLEKLEIERTYWADRGVDWGLVTDQDIPMALSKNVEWVHDSLLPEVPEDLLCQIETALFAELEERADMPLSKLALKVDRDLGMKPGLALSVVRHLIASRQWLVDMNQLILTDKPLSVTRNFSDIALA